MKIFVSGASGLVGGQCLNYLSEKGLQVVGSHLNFPTEKTVYYNSLDSGHSDNFNLMDWKPDVIIHCGALTHVDYCEEHPNESYNQTVQSTKNLLMVSHQIGAQLVLLSTDYVFDGANGPYSESHLPNPLNVYGHHKLECEKLVTEQSSRNLIIRITNVYGDEIRNKNFVSRIIQQCEKSDSLQLNLPIDQYATPTNAYDIARAIYELIIHDKKGVYHIGGTDFMNRVELALKILSYYPEAQYKLNPVITADLNQVARRPLYGGLVSARFKSEFPDFLFSSVDNYLTRRLKQLIQ